MYMSPSCSRIVPAKRNALSRSPSQSRNPETAKRSAKAAVSAAFTFWPALKRPCGVRPPRSQRTSSSSNRSSSRAVRRRPRRSPSATSNASAIAHATAVQMCAAFTSGRRPTASLSFGTYSARPVASNTKNAAACTQWTARSVREKRRTYAGAAVARPASVAIRAPDPRVLVVAADFPVPRLRLRHEVDPLDPLDVLVAVHLGDQQPHRRAVLARERLPVLLVGEQDVRQRRLSCRQRVDVRALGRRELEAVRRRQRFRLGQQVAHADTGPVNVVDAPAGDAVEGSHLLGSRERAQLVVVERQR